MSPATIFCCWRTIHSSLCCAAGRRSANGRRATDGRRAKRRCAERGGLCSLANARSIPVAQEITRRFANPDTANLIGRLHINISGCINACGHHHVGHIGILGLEKRGAESYQITLGGDATENAAIGEIIGPGIAAEDVPDAIDRLVNVYLAERLAGEDFIAAVRRLGIAPFKSALQEGASDVAA